MPTSSPAGSEYFHARVNGGMLRYYPIPLSHSTYQGGSVGLRDDVGIVPHIHDGLHSMCNCRGIAGISKENLPAVTGPGGLFSLFPPAYQKHNLRSVERRSQKRPEVLLRQAGSCGKGTAEPAGLPGGQTDKSVVSLQRYRDPVNVQVLLLGIEIIIS